MISRLMPEGNVAQELPATAKDASRKKEKVQLSANVKLPQRLEQIEEGTEQDHEHLHMPEVNAEFIEQVRNFLLSTN